MTDLIQHYRALADTGTQLRGLSILQHKDSIGQLVRIYKAKSLLDYGCGAGDQYKQPHRLHREWGLQWFDIKLYDPAFAHNEKPHGKFDGVLCSDVLEHVPEADVPETIATLFRHARYFVWASVCCRPAKKAFPDGTNLHVTLKPMDWWQEQFARACPDGVAFVLEETP